MQTVADMDLVARYVRNNSQDAFEELVSRVLSLDYLGALLASLVFPLWFVPTLGLVRTGN